ncbi:MAG: acetyl-CoA carboxylase biotin carboxylase subunit [Candidatus Wallbacteria bacterium]|nr:acetyl-CoA carboxylase biotin carboxylase subunit [Candidatus Wallbacteria bacterium]
MSLLRKVLIANRGEIAVRILRSCRELGIPVVAVYSEADQAALHAQLADEAICIGPSEARASYLNIERVVRAALDSGCDAIHPGYGFLSENPAFARACEAAKLVFIGPPSEVIRKLGDKTEARALMQAAGIPVLPGTEPFPEWAPELVTRARAIGYPVLVKAAAGGGGKGMRIVAGEAQLCSSVEASIREATHAFGDGRVFLEKLLERPRHVEFQVLADSQGHAVHLFERECSIQRRHQKILEEAPCLALDAELRERMGLAAVEAARAAGYVNAGTVEFLLGENRRFYFLEVNTRLQVEHPITEMVTGLDLVELQLRIAAGEPLPFAQADVTMRGHSMECRIYAEDPFNGFLPATGVVLGLAEPSGPGVRVDSGIHEGSEVTVHYDPMLAKLTVKASNREACRRRLIAALREYRILGVTTNAPYMLAVASHPEFAAGRTHTGFLAEHLLDVKRSRQHRDAAVVAAALAFASSARATAPGAGAEGDRPASTPWQELGHWRLADASGRSR